MGLKSGPDVVKLESKLGHSGVEIVSIYTLLFVIMQKIIVLIGLSLNINIKSINYIYVKVGNIILFHQIGQNYENSF